MSSVSVGPGKQRIVGPVEFVLIARISCQSTFCSPRFALGKLILIVLVGHNVNLVDTILGIGDLGNVDILRVAVELAANVLKVGDLPVLNGELLFEHLVNQWLDLGFRQEHQVIDVSQ